MKILKVVQQERKLSEATFIAKKDRISGTDFYENSNSGTDYRFNHKLCEYY